MSEVYVAMYDRGGDRFMLGQRRGPNRWVRSELNPYGFTIGEPGQFVLPGGKVHPFETPQDASHRLFKELTGNRIAFTTAITTVFKVGPCVVTCYAAFFMDAFEDRINGGLVPSPVQSETPRNGQVVNWELGKVVGSDKKSLPNYLGKTEIINGATSKIVDTKCPSGQKFRDMIPKLQAVEFRT